MPVIILAGDEEFELSRRVAELKASILDPSWASMNFIQLSNPNMTQIGEAAASLPFGLGNRLVLIDRCELFTKRRGKDGTAGGAQKSAGTKQTDKQAKESSTPEALEAALASISEKTYVVFACPYNFDATLKIAKSALKFAQPETFSKEKYFPGSKNIKLETWCRKEAKRHGVTIDDAAIEYLLAGSEANLRQISSELEKAATTLLPKTHITYDFIAEISPHQSHVFAFADLWLSNQLVGALTALGELTARQSAMPVLAAMQTMLSKWIKIKILSDHFNQSAPHGASARKELPVPEPAKKIAFELKLMPFSVEKDLKRLAKLSSEELVTKRIELARLEFLIKSGQIPEKHALEMFVLQGKAA